MAKTKNNVPLEKIVSKVAALGVPGLILLIAIAATGLTGAAAITAALAALGPGGILGCIATLGVIGLLTNGISEYGVNAIFTGVVKITQILRFKFAVLWPFYLLTQKPITCKLQYR